MRALILLILLAACAREAPPGIEADVVIRVTGEGTVHWNEERMTLADVAARLSKLDYENKVVVDGAADADWAHVQWTVAVVRAWGWEPVVLTLESASRVYILPEFAHDLLIHVPYLQMRVTRTAQGATQFELGHKKTTRLDDACRWIGDGGALIDPYGFFAVNVAGDVELGAVHPVLASVHRLDRIILHAGVERPHLWVMTQDPLPFSAEVFGEWHWQLGSPDMTPLTLPLATKGQEDKDDDPDDRIILNVDPEGTVHFGGEVKTLDDVAESLRGRSRLNDSLRRSWYPDDPHPGYEELEDGRLLSKLYVLLRADHDLPWNRVLPIVDTLDTSGFYRLQFATQRYATLDHSAEDAARVGVERIEVAPSGWPTFECKLQCFLATAHDDSERFIEVKVSASGRFRIDGTDFPDVAQLAAEIKARYRKFDEISGVTVKGRILADPESRYQDVISALDAFGRAGLEKVDLK